MAGKDGLVGTSDSLNVLQIHTPRFNKSLQYCGNIHNILAITSSNDALEFMITSFEDMI